VEGGFNILVGARKERILQAWRSGAFRGDFGRDLYGGGHASERIVEEMLS